MIMMRVGGIMKTLLSLVSLTRRDLVSFHSVFLKCAIKEILLEAYRELSQESCFLCIFKTVNVLVQMSVLRFHIDSIVIGIEHKLFQCEIVKTQK